MCSKLSKLIEEGKPVKGLKLLYAIDGRWSDNNVFCPVTVESLKSECGSGFKVVVSPVGGIGSITCEPCKLIEDTAKARAEFTAKENAKKDKHRFHSIRLLRQKRAALALLFDDVPKKRADAIRQDLKDRNQDPEKLSEDSLRRIGDELIDIKHGIETKEQ